MDGKLYTTYSEDHTLRRFPVVFLLLLASVGAFGQMVWFEPNRGQVAGKTEWIGRSQGAYLYITGDEVVYANKQNIHMRLVGAACKSSHTGRFLKAHMRG